MVEVDESYQNDKCVKIMKEKCDHMCLSFQFVLAWAQIIQIPWCHNFMRCHIF